MLEELRVVNFSIDGEGEREKQRLACSGAARLDKWAGLFFLLSQLATGHGKYLSSTSLVMQSCPSPCLR